jgi:hypothetical protein
MSDNPDRNFEKNEEFCSQLNAYFERHMAFRKANEVSCVFRQKLTVSSILHYYVQKQMQLLSLLSLNKYIIFYGLNIFYYLFSSTLLITLNLSFISVLSYCFFLFFFKGYLLLH